MEFKKTPAIPRLPILKLITIRQVICQTKPNQMNLPPPKKSMPSVKAFSVNTFTENIPA